jgi:AhpD family alkylhydroperoxidase
MTEVLHQKDQVERVKLYQVSPELYEAMQVLSNAAAKDIDPDLAELIKIRASQLNRCVFCLDMHSHDARNRGISPQKLALVAAWAEASELFTERERAALALTEEITELTGRGHVSDEVYSRAAAVFSERELGQVIAMALTTNAWNRISVTTRLKPAQR